MCRQEVPLITMETTTAFKTRQTSLLVHPLYWTQEQHKDVLFYSFLKTHISPYSSPSFSLVFAIFLRNPTQALCPKWQV